MPDTTPTTNSNPPVADDWLIVTEALEAAGWTGADDNPLEILKKDGACWAISNDCYDSAVSKDGWTVEFPSDTPVSVVIAACLAAAPPARQVLGTTDQQPTTAPVDRFRTAWHSARSRAAVLSAEITRRAPLLGEYAAQIANLRTMYDVADARTNDLIEERDQLLTERTAPVDRAAVLAATLREVLDTFGPMTEVYGGPVAYYDGSADITPAQYEGWRAVLDDEPSRLADEAQPATDQPTAHRCDNCDGIDPDTCFNNPHRPPEQCPAAEFEDYGQQCQKPVGHESHTFEERPIVEVQQPEAEAHVSDADRILAYRNTDRPGVLLCRMHGEGWMGLTPLTSEDLPDGGICTWPGSPRSGPCHRDVLATPAPSEESK